MKPSETSALLEIIKEQNKTIESLRKTIDEMNVNSKLLREQIDYLNRKLFGNKEREDGQSRRSDCYGRGIRTWTL